MNDGADTIGSIVRPACRLSDRTTEQDQSFVPPFGPSRHPIKSTVIRNHFRFGFGRALAASSKARTFDSTPSASRNARRWAANCSYSPSAWASACFLASCRGFHDGSGAAHRKAEYTNATAPVLPGLKQTRHQDEKDGIKCREAAASQIHAVKG
ncbi:MAG TPA: hypothetical protein VFN29_00480 [Chiayiivirga sp.]|nr:hypothetical protein [Chiayiivirga sp.]